MLRPLARRLRHKFRELRGTELRLRNDVALPTVSLGSVYGGWTVARVGLPERPVLFSVGLGRDVTFDLAAIDALNARVIGFDPTPKSKAYVESLALPAAFTFVPVGLGARDGTLTFHLPRADFDSFSVAGDAATSAVTVTCPVARLSTLARDAGVDAIDILKMDIERAEYDVIPDVLASGVPVGQLLVELHYDPVAAEVERAMNLVASIRAAGYRLFHRSGYGKELSFIHERLLPAAAATR